MEILNRFPQLQEAEEWEIDSVIEQHEIFNQALAKFVQRNHIYRDLWQKSGWLAHLVEVKRKIQRMIHVFMDTDAWKEMEDPLDDAYDSLNYHAFFVRKFKEGDRSGGMSV